MSDRAGQWNPAFGRAGDAPLLLRVAPRWARPARGSHQSPAFVPQPERSFSFALLAAYFALVFIPFTSSGAPAQTDTAVSARSLYPDKVQKILTTYCYDCHGDGMEKGKVAFDQFNSRAEMLNRRDLFFAALKNVRAGIMPPAKKPHPDTKEQQVLADWIKADIFQIDPANPDPGKVTIRRLNRVEYRNVNDCHCPGCPPGSQLFAKNPWLSRLDRRMVESTGVNRDRIPVNETTGCGSTVIKIE